MTDKKSNSKEIIYVFNNVDVACVAAIEYVIREYGDQQWFNAALNKVITDIYSKNKKEDICHTPFIIIKREYSKDNRVLLRYKGYHYIIYQIEKYNSMYNKKVNGINTFIFIMYNLLIIIALIILFKLGNSKLSINNEFQNKGLNTVSY